jgi:hypothetical protein
MTTRTPIIPALKVPSEPVNRPVGIYEMAITLIRSNNKKNPWRANKVVGCVLYHEEYLH